MPPGATDSAAPYPAWQLTDTSAGQISAAGEFKGGASSKDSDLIGKLGSLASNTLKLSVQDVPVSISPATGSLGLVGAASIAFKAANTFGDGSTNTLVTYVSGDPDKVYVGSTGIAVPGAQAESSYGVATIAATLKNDGRRAATAAVTLTNILVSSLSGSGAWNPVAQFKDPVGVAVDGAGNVYVADYNNHAIRRLTILP